MLFFKKGQSKDLAKQAIEEICYTLILFWSLALFIHPSLLIGPCFLTYVLIAIEQSCLPRYVLERSAH